MDYAYLLDTNILSDLVRHPQGQVFQCIASMGEARFAQASLLHVNSDLVLKRVVRIASFVNWKVSLLFCLF
jgi:predicted nucleic acid-binding protein